MPSKLSNVDTDFRSQETTIIGDFERQIEGYITIIQLDDTAKQLITSIQDKLTKSLGTDNLWLPNGDQLHITFAHAISPDVDYKKPRNKLYENKKNIYEVLCVSAKVLAGAKIKFDDIEAYPSAIILKSSIYNGAVKNARQFYSRSLDLPAGTRRPPDIVHVTICRFKSKMNMKKVKDAVAGIETNIKYPEVRIDKLYLVHEKMMYAADFGKIAEFPVNYTENENQ